MNGAVFQTLKKRACFARFPTLSTCRNEDKKIRQFTNLILIFSITEKYIVTESNCALFNEKKLYKFETSCSNDLSKINQ
ncbi:hypothetical protein SAMN05518672_103543 [Chitinophaga sp. CF118]|nr:hypothetical protein SAMN05518672_103543 [Chitinophaga sp. CF118]